MLEQLKSSSWKINFKENLFIKVTGLFALLLVLSNIFFGNTSTFIMSIDGPISIIMLIVAVISLLRINKLGKIDFILAVINILLVLYIIYLIFI